MKILDSFAKLKALYSNRSVEEDLTLDEQRNRLVNWATYSDMEPKWRREIINKIAKMDKVLSGKEWDNFVEELARLKLGVSVTEEEAATIVELCKKIDKAKEIGDEKEIEKARADMEDYKNKIINE